MPTSDAHDVILDAVIARIAQDGIDGASMRSVAKQADVSLGLLSYHFDDKQALIVAAFRRACERLQAVSNSSVEDETLSPADRIVRLVRSPFVPEFLDDEYLALRISMWALARTDDQIADVERDLYLPYSEQLTALIRVHEPKLSAQKALDRATDCLLTQNGLWLNWARYHDEHDLERGLRRCDAIALGEPFGD